MKRIKRDFRCGCGEDTVYGLDGKCIKCLINDGFFNDAPSSTASEDISLLNDAVTLTVSSKFKNYIHRFNHLAQSGYIGDGVRLVNMRPDIGNGSYHFADLVIPNFSRIDYDVLKNIHGSFKGLSLVIYDIDRGGDTRYENISYHRTYATEEEANNVGYGLTLMFELFQAEFKKLVKSRVSHYAYAISTLTDFKYKKPLVIGEWCYKNARRNKAVVINGKSVTLTFNRGTTYHKSVHAVGRYMIAMFIQAENNKQRVWETERFGDFSIELLRSSGLRNTSEVLDFARRRVGF